MKGLKGDLRKEKESDLKEGLITVKQRDPGEVLRSGRGSGSFTTRCRGVRGLYTRWSP